MDAMVQAMDRKTRRNLGDFVGGRLFGCLGWWLCYSRSANVQLWEPDGYLTEDTQLLKLICPGWIKGHLALNLVTVGEGRVKVWVTIDMAKVCQTVCSASYQFWFLYSKNSRIVLFVNFILDENDWLQELPVVAPCGHQDIPKFVCLSKQLVL